MTTLAGCGAYAIDGEVYALHALTLGAPARIETISTRAAEHAPQGVDGMKIMVIDGREFQGTPLQIVRSMQALAFAAVDYTVPRYVEWVAGNARRFPAVELDVKGATDDELAASLVSEMLRTGLARTM